VIIPSQYESQNGQQWLLDRDTSNNYVIKVINHGRELAGFPVKASNPERETETTTLGEQKYTIISVTLNSDNYSGYVTLKK
jgi:acetoacetate decarboxylase